ncbi:hypothetical protein [Treponema sp.]|uniref:hypothetical protein n=1 Tax=Treponema sp. TaxID=166 RepID=UPI002A7F96CC|nr:hypothetical protein [Treponema sp.]MDY4133599.1 hypothetical protein [Treponema sp.]
MKRIFIFLFSISAFLFFSCNQLNINNPVGAVSVCLPGSSSRMIVDDGTGIDGLKKGSDVSYKIYLYSSSGALVDKKSASEGSSVTFPDVAVGSYVVKAFCYVTQNGKEECIAAGVKTAEVKGGEVTPVNLELLYNRPDRIDLSRTSIKYSGKTEFPDMDEMTRYVADSFKNFLSAEIVFTNGWSETVIDSDGFSVERVGDSQISGGKEAHQFKVTLSLYENITKELIVTLYVKELQNNDPTVGLSEENPCLTSEALLAAITNSRPDGTIYIGGKDEGSGYEFLLTETPTITKNLTIKSAVDNLTVKRNSGAYIYIKQGCKLNINETLSDKPIEFTDADNTCSTNFIYDGLKGGSLVAYNAKFSNVGFGAVLVESAELYGCAFNAVSARYGAVHISAQYSAIVDGCTFSGNTSTNAVGYGDIYLAKGSDDTKLTLSGNVSTDIKIYVANNTCSDPKIDVGGISFADGKKLRVKVETLPEEKNERITVFVNASEDMKDYMTFAISNNAAYTEEYTLWDLINDYDKITNSDSFYSMFDSGEYYVYKHEW